MVELVNRTLLLWWCWLLTLGWLLGPVGTAREDSTNLCHRVKSQNYFNTPLVKLQFQALTVTKKYLFLIESNLLYRIPRDRIRNGKIFMLDPKREDSSIEPVDWFRERSLIFQSPQKMRKLGILRWLTVFPINRNLRYIHYVFKNVSLLVEFDRRNKSFEIIRKSHKSKHWLSSVSDGHGNGYLFQIDPAHEDWKTKLPRVAVLPIFANTKEKLIYMMEHRRPRRITDSHYHLINSIYRNKVAMVPSSRMQSYLIQVELLSNLPIGFIQDNLVYLLSVDRGQAYIMDFYDLRRRSASNTTSSSNNTHTESESVPRLPEDYETGAEMELDLGGQRFRELFVCSKLQVEFSLTETARVFNYRVPLAAYLAVLATLLSVVSVMGGIVMARKIIDSKSGVTRSQSSRASLIDTINQLNRRAKRRISFESNSPHFFDNRHSHRTKLKLTIV